jgi:hypothetical protein
MREEMHALQGACTSVITISVEQYAIRPGVIATGAVLRAMGYMIRGDHMYARTE